MSIRVIPNPGLSVLLEEVAEDSGTPEESFGEMLEATAVYRGPWNRRWEFMQGMMPAVTPTPGTLDLALRLPYQYPYRTDLQMFVDNVSCRPWAGNPAKGSPGPHQGIGTLAWEWCLLRPHFSTLQNNDPRSIVWQESFSPATEFITVPATDSDYQPTLYWDAGLTDAIGASAAPGLRFSKIEWTVVRRWAPLNFPAAVLDYVGTINSAAVTSAVYPALSFDPGQLLYDSFTPEPDRFADGTAAVKLTMKFIGLAGTATWNTFPHVNKAGATQLAFDPIYRKSDGGQWKPFELTDLNALLRW